MFVCSQTRMMTSTISLRTSKTRTVLKGYSMRTAFSGAMIGWAASSLCRWSFFSCLGWDYLATVYYKPDSSRYSKRLKTNQNDLEILHQTFYQWSFQGAVVWIWSKTNKSHLSLFQMFLWRRSRVCVQPKVNLGWSELKQFLRLLQQSCRRNRFFVCPLGFCSNKKSKLGFLTTLQTVQSWTWWHPVFPQS